MDENYTPCNRCGKFPCCCRNLDIVNRRHDYLLRTMDLNKLEDYFGISDTDYATKSISLERKSVYCYIVTIKKMNIYNPLHTYIDGLPRDVNNVIYSYLWEPNLYIKLSLVLPHDYPFSGTNWTILKYIKNGKEMNKCEKTEKASCLLRYNSPSISLDKEILTYLSINDDF